MKTLKKNNWSRQWYIKKENIVNDNKKLSLSSATKNKFNTDAEVAEFLEQENPQNLIRYRRSNGDNNQPPSTFVPINVPGDGSCLFWATTLAYLLPVEDDADADVFSERFERLFGEEESGNIRHIRELVREYDPFSNNVRSDRIFNRLVTRVLRNRVVDYISSNENDFRNFVEGESGRSFNEYLDNMRDRNTWGGEPEIEAMGRMLGATINVDAGGAVHTRGDGDGNIPIRLYHVNAARSASQGNERNHYNFGLERTLHQQITNEVVPELIDYLFQIDKNHDFKQRFQSFLDQIPRPGGVGAAPAKKGFYVNFFAGMFTTLKNTELFDRLGLAELHFKICTISDADEVPFLKVVAITEEPTTKKLEEYVFVISEKRYSRQIMGAIFSRDDRRWLEESRLLFSEGDDTYHLRSRAHTRADEIEFKSGAAIIISKTNNRDRVNVIRREQLTDQVLPERMRVKFRRIEKHQKHKTGEYKSNLLEDIVKNLNGETVDDPLRDIEIVQAVQSNVKKLFEYICDINRKYHTRLPNIQGALEAADHGFTAGALINFKYRYNLELYLELLLGIEGYIDVALLVRGSQRVKKAMPILVEIKTGQEQNGRTNPQQALREAESYTQGLQQNNRPFITLADRVVRVGFNMDYANPIKISMAELQPPAPIIRTIFESVNSILRGQERRDDIKTSIVDQLKKIHRLSPGTQGSGEPQYLSRLFIGHSILNSVENDETRIDKRVLTYKKLKETTRGTRRSHGITTSVFIERTIAGSNTGDSRILIVHFHEGGRDNIDINDPTLRVPLNGIINQANCKEVIEVYVDARSGNDGSLKFLTEDNGVIIQDFTNSVNDYFQTNVANHWEIHNLPDFNQADNLKLVLDEGMSYQPKKGQDNKVDLGSNGDMFTSIGKNLFPIRSLITNEAYFAAMLSGLLNSYSDIEFQGDFKINVRSEFQVGGGERIDLFINVMSKNPADSDVLIGLELKYGDGRVTIDSMERTLKKAEKVQLRRYGISRNIRAITEGASFFVTLPVGFVSCADTPDSLVITREQFVAYDIERSFLGQVHPLGRSVQRNEQTLESVTLQQNPDYRYWLSDQDIRRIAHHTYSNMFDVHATNNNYDTSGRGLVVVTEERDQDINTGELHEQIRQFTDNVDNNRIVQQQGVPRRTFIINQGGDHWTTLVIAQQNGQYRGYYVDSLGSEIPNNIHQILIENNIGNLINFQIHQQTDPYNCGLWSLENARDINTMLQENRDELWVRTQLAPTRLDRNSEEYFRGKRREFAQVLLDSQAQVDSSHSINTDSTSDLHVSLSQCLNGNRKKRSTNKCLYSWYDVDKFNAEQQNRRNIDGIKIDSWKFLNYIKNVEDEDKRVQLLELAKERIIVSSNNLTNNHKYLLSNAIHNKNKSNLLDDVLKSIQLSAMLLSIGRQSVPRSLQKIIYCNVLINIGMLIHDHRDYIYANSPDHINSLAERIDNNQLLHVAANLYRLLKNKGSINYNKFSSVDEIKSYFSDENTKVLRAEVEAYSQEVLTVHSNQVFMDTSNNEIYVKIKHNDGNKEKIVIGNIVDIQNVENYVLDEESFEIKLRIDDNRGYDIIQYLNQGSVKHYLNVSGRKVQVDTIVRNFPKVAKKAIHNKIALLQEQKSIEQIADIEEVTDYNNIIDKLDQYLLELGVSTNTLNRLKNHLDGLNKEVFEKYVNSLKKDFEKSKIKFDQNKLNLSKVKGEKVGKFFAIMAIYDLFDSIVDNETFGRHNNDILKKVFGINGILDAIDDVRTSLNISNKNKVIGKVINKIPKFVRKSLTVLIDNPIVRSVTFATVAYQFGYNIDEIANNNHHPLNYYWASSSGIKLTSMSMKPISAAVQGVSAVVKGIGSASRIMKVLLVVKFASKLASVTTVIDMQITGITKISQRLKIIESIASQIPLSQGEKEELFFAEVIKFFTRRDIEQEYEEANKIRMYLDFVKKNAFNLLNEHYSIAAVVQYVAGVGEKYNKVIKIDEDSFFDKQRRLDADSRKHIDICVDTKCTYEKELYDTFFVKVNDRDNYIRGNLSLLDISKTLPLERHTLDRRETTKGFTCSIIPHIKCHVIVEQELGSKEIYVIDFKKKFMPYLTQHEYEDRGLRVVSVPLGDLTIQDQCGDVVNPIRKTVGNENTTIIVNDDYVCNIVSYCNVNETHRSCQRNFLFSGEIEPFIFTNPKRKDPYNIKKRKFPENSILYLPGPNELIAAENYPAVMYIHKNMQTYQGSRNNETVAIVNDIPRISNLSCGKVKGNILIISNNISNVTLNVNLYGQDFSSTKDNRFHGAIGLTNMYNYLSYSNVPQHIATHCKTRYVNAASSEVGNKIYQNEFATDDELAYRSSYNCKSLDYEIRVINNKDQHYAGGKKIVFIFSKNSGSAEILYSSNVLKKKKSIDILNVKDVDDIATQCRIGIGTEENSYNIELLSDNKQDVISSVKVNSFRKLIVKASQYLREQTVVIKNKSLLNILADMKYQVLSGSGVHIDAKVIQNSKSELEAIVLVSMNVRNSFEMSAYEIAKSIMNNNTLNLPMQMIEVVQDYLLVPVKKAVIGGVYSDIIPIDFSYNNNNPERGYNISRNYGNNVKSYCDYIMKCGHYQVTTVEGGREEDKYIFILPKNNYVSECITPNASVNLYLEIKNEDEFYQNSPNDIVDLTVLNITEVDNVKVSKSHTNDYTNLCFGNIFFSNFTGDHNVYVRGIRFSHAGIEWHLLINLISYEVGLENQHIAFQFDKDGSFYKINDARLKLEPIETINMTQSSEHSAIGQSEQHPIRHSRHDKRDGYWNNIYSSILSQADYQGSNTGYVSDGSEPESTIQLSYVVNQQLEQLDSKIINGLKYLLASIGIKNNVKTYQCLGFDSSIDQVRFVNVHNSDYDNQHLKQILQHDRAVEALMWLIAKSYSDSSLRSPYSERSELLAEIDPCFETVIDKKIIHRLVRHLEKEDIVFQVERFVEHHQQALKYRMQEKVKSDLDDNYLNIEEQELETIYNNTKYLRNRREADANEEDTLIVQGNVIDGVENDQEQLSSFYNNDFVQPISSGASRLESWPVKLVKNIRSTMVDVVNYLSANSFEKVAQILPNTYHDASRLDTSTKPYLSDIGTNTKSQHNYEVPNNNHEHSTPASSTENQEVNCVPYAWDANSQKYVADVISCTSPSGQAKIFSNIYQGTNFAQIKGYSIQRDSYKNCRPIEFYGKPSIYCEGNHTNLVYTTNIIPPSLDQINAQLMLARAFGIDKLIGKLVTKAKILLGLEKTHVTNEENASLNSSIVEITTQQRSEWQVSIKSIESLLKTLSSEVSEENRQWARNILEDRIEEIAELSKQSTVNTEIITELNENLKVLQTELKESIECIHTTDYQQQGLQQANNQQCNSRYLVHEHLVHCMSALHVDNNIGYCGTTNLHHVIDQYPQIVSNCT